jgi:hypothetical protein
MHGENGHASCVCHADVSTPTTSIGARYILGIREDLTPVGETRVGDIVIPANKSWLDDECLSTTQFTLRLRKHPSSYPEDYVIWPAGSMGVVIEVDGGLRRVLVETGQAGWALSIQLRRYTR